MPKNLPLPPMRYHFSSITNKPCRMPKLFPQPHLKFRKNSLKEVGHLAQHTSFRDFE